MAEVWEPRRTAASNSAREGGGGVADGGHTCMAKSMEEGAGVVREGVKGRL